MRKPHVMTVQDLYNFAKEHNMEKAQIWFPSGTNAFSSTSRAEATLKSTKDAALRIYLVG